MMSLRTLTAVVVVMAGASIALGVGITSIGVLATQEGGTADSRVYAISGDGTYAVGSSNTGLAVNSHDQPVIWSAGTGILRLGAATADNAVARGVVIRPLNGRIGVGGFAVSKGLQMYDAPLNDLGNGTWSPTIYGTSSTMGAYNISRLSAHYGAAEVWHTAGQRLTAIKRGYIAAVGASVKRQLSVLLNDNYSSLFPIPNWWW